MRLPRIALALFALALLAACAGGPPKRVYPPQATIQELRVQPDGRWQARIRIQNFSTVPMRFSRLQASLLVGGQEAARIDADPALTVGPGSAEVVEQLLSPSAAGKAAVDAALANRRGVRYALSGRLASSDPGTDDPIEYESALDPVPGLEGVLR